MPLLLIRPAAGADAGANADANADADADTDTDTDTDAEPPQANGSEASSYEHFQNTPNQIPNQNNLTSQTPLYQDALSMGAAGFFPGQTGFQQPVSNSLPELRNVKMSDECCCKQAQYHQYAPVGPHNPTLLGYQRNVHDLFLPNDFREEIQKRTAATLQTIPNLHLPAHVESYHSLVPLDTNQKSSAILSGYSSWIYKAQSSSSAKFFALRRIEGKRQQPMLVVIFLFMLLWTDSL
jgi:PAB-dependent poly(A)-specific ribonuclease subunit 3